MKKGLWVSIERKPDGTYLVGFWFATDLRYDKTCRDIPVVEIIEWVK